MSITASWGVVVEAAQIRYRFDHALNTTQLVLRCSAPDGHPQVVMGRGVDRDISVETIRAKVHCVSTYLCPRRFVPPRVCRHLSTCLRYKGYADDHGTTVYCCGIQMELAQRVGYLCCVSVEQAVKCCRSPCAAAVVTKERRVSHLSEVAFEHATAAYTRAMQAVVG